MGEDPRFLAHLFVLVHNVLQLVLPIFLPSGQKWKNEGAIALVLYLVPKIPSCRVMVFFKQFFFAAFFVSSMFPTDNIFLFLETLLRCSSISHPSLLVSRDSTIPYVFIGKKRCSVTLEKGGLLRNECCKKSNFLPGGLLRNSGPWW